MGPFVSFNSRARKGRDTRPSASARWRSSRFNSRARKGRDVVLTALVGGEGFQFTRPQGARLHTLRAVSMATSFNSRARKGRDPERIYHFS